MQKIEFSEHAKKADELIPLMLNLIDEVFEIHTEKRELCNKLFEQLLKKSNDVPIGEKSNITKLHIDRLFDWLNTPNQTLTMLKNSKEFIQLTHDRFYSGNDEEHDPIAYASEIANGYYRVAGLYFKYIKFNNTFNDLLKKYDGLLNGDTLSSIPLPSI